MKNNQQEQTIEKTQGRAMLRWDGKKPLERIEYFPAQEKEVYGDKEAKDFNKLFWGDNLQVLAHLLKEHRGKIDLIYIDPPFDSKADYVKKVKIRGNELDGIQKSIIEEKQYGDIWERDEYLQFMFERLVLMRELLTERGSIYLHCDWHKSHFLRLILDEVFGEDNFVNEIVWHYYNKMQGNVGRFASNHDAILVYRKSSKAIFHSIREDREKVKKQQKRVWDSETQTLKQARDEKGDLVYYEDTQRTIDDVWRLPYIMPADVSQKLGYPTQKPETLLERIILASSDVGSTVLDCFCGSGTTLAVAQKLGRRWIGCDINIGAIQTTTKRLNQILDAQSRGETEKDTWLLEEKEIAGARKLSSFGFKVFNVNEYDVFKNEVEAKDIIMEMYGVERIRSGYFDGVLDNNFVKVMPINRVCSKKDVDEVLKGIKDNLGDFTAKTKSRHGESVYQQGVSVFCSGMELDMLDYLKKNNATGVDVDVRDILLDKQTLIFKQKPEAEIAIKAGDKKATVTISDFISPILMRKLEIENEKALKQESRAKVDDYRQVIDSVAIDVDYDGDLFNAEIIDVPAKNELIKGEYVLEYAKKGKTTVAIKIVDVLGEEYFESFEVTV
ncbi:MAG: adenine specific DNA methylase Mod [Parcubacteria group bacterium GW2011_GWF2_50_9]|nr:MAG: adenine specific DNA methylase Mod [Parcubacteria group bacterium GW2011_GWF2_50_9]